MRAALVRRCAGWLYMPTSQSTDINQQQQGWLCFSHHPKQHSAAPAQTPHPGRGGQDGRAGQRSDRMNRQADKQPRDFSVILESILSNFAICPGGSSGSMELICRLLPLLQLYRTSFWSRLRGLGVEPTGAERRVDTATRFPALHHGPQCV